MNDVISCNQIDGWNDNYNNIINNKLNDNFTNVIDDKINNDNKNLNELKNNNNVLFNKYFK